MTGKKMVTVEMTWDEETGQVVIEVIGHQGPDCLKLTENLSKALGQTTEITKKPEFNRVPAGQAVKAKNTQKTGAGGW